MVVTVVVDVVGQRLAFLVQTADAATDARLAGVVLAQVLRIGQHGFEELQRHNFHALVVDGLDAGHADVLNHAQVGQIFLAEGHPEPGAPDGGEVDNQRLQLLVVHEVALTRANHGVGEGLVDLQSAGLDPFAVLPVAAFLGDFADVDFGVEVGGECLAVVAGVAVHDVEGVHLAEVVLGGVCSINAAHARVKAAAQDGRQPSLLKALAVSPLPAVLEVGLVARLIVGGIQIVNAATQAGFHDGQVLIGQGQIDDHVGLVAVEQSHELVHVVGIYLVSGDVVFADGSCHSVTLGAVA